MIAIVVAVVVVVAPLRLSVVRTTYLSTVSNTDTQILAHPLTSMLVLTGPASMLFLYPVLFLSISLPHPLNSVLVNYYPPSVCIHIGLRSTLLNHLIGVVMFFSFGCYDDGRIADDRLAVPCDGDSLASNLSWRFWEVGGSYPNEPTPKPPCSELLLLTRSSGAAAGHGFHLFHH